MFVTRDKIVTTLLTWGIEPREPGDGMLEFEIMDKDFRNQVRFKDFCKFVKKHKKGKAYEEIDSPDSSMSSSEEVELKARETWRDIFDPERNCEVENEKAIHCFATHPFQLFEYTSITAIDLVKKTIDKNKNGKITF